MINSFDRAPYRKIRDLRELGMVRRDKVHECVEACPTLGDAALAGLRPHAACVCGKRSGIGKVEPCGFSAYLDLGSIIWTRGANFPCWRLSQRLKCPQCGGTSIELVWLPGRIVFGPRGICTNAPSRRGMIFG
jgi:hypothetical protein